jgi:hypothetical protein
LLCRRDFIIGKADNQLDSAIYEIGHKCREGIRVPIPPPPLYNDVLAFFVAYVSQRISEDLVLSLGRRFKAKVADASNIAWLLRAQSQRCSEQSPSGEQERSALQSAHASVSN